MIINFAQNFGMRGWGSVDENVVRALARGREIVCEKTHGKVAPAGYLVSDAS